MKFFGKKEKKGIPTVPKELAKYVENLESKIEKLSTELGEFKQNMQKAVTRVGIVRFNPFKETGSDQSFAIALLNQSNNGVVFTSHYLKEYNRMYAKPVISGKSEYSLSREEEEAISRAIDSGKSEVLNPKS